MLAFLGGVSVVATSMIFLGGFAARESMWLGVLLSGAGGAWLGVIYGSLAHLALADSRQRPRPEADERVARPAAAGWTEVSG